MTVLNLSSDPKTIAVQDPKILAGICEAFSVLTELMQNDEDISIEALYKITFDCIAFEFAKSGDWIETTEKLIRSHPKIFFKCADAAVSIYQALNMVYQEPTELDVITYGLFAGPKQTLLEVSCNISAQRRNGILSYININKEIEKRVRKYLFMNSETTRIMIDVAEDMVYAECPIDDVLQHEFPKKIQKDEWEYPNVTLQSRSTAEWYLFSVSQKQTTRPANTFAEYCWRHGDKFLRSWLADVHRFDEEIFSHLGTGSVREMLKNIR